MPKKISKGKLVIRAAKPKELEKIEAMAKAGVFEKGVETAVNLDKTVVFVALHENRIVGFSQCEERRRLQKGSKQRKIEGFITRTEVAKPFQGKGIGHKLVGKANSLFESRGLKTSRLVSLTKAERFHQKAGYKSGLDFKTVVKMKRISPNARRRIK